MYYYHHAFGIVGAVVWLAVAIYLLTLATRLVRAIEKIAGKSDAKPS